MKKINILTSAALCAMLAAAPVCAEDVLIVSSTDNTQDSAESSAAVSDEIAIVSGGEVLAEGDFYENNSKIREEREHFAVVGAELFTTKEDGTGIRIYYEFTHFAGDSDGRYADSYVSASAQQNGVELDKSKAKEEVPESKNDNYKVMPGVTVVVTAEYACDPNAGSVTFSLMDYYGEEIACDLDPNNLPGRPPVTRTIDDMENSDYFDYLPESSEEGDTASIAFTGSEKVTVDGEDYLRVSFNLTNLTGSNQSQHYAPALTCYQNGVLQEKASSGEIQAVKEEQTGSDVLSANATEEFSYDFTLRSDSPVLILANANNSWIIAAASYEVE